MLFNMLMFLYSGDVAEKVTKHLYSTKEGVSVGSEAACVATIRKAAKAGPAAVYPSCRGGGRGECVA